jgi:hypothetical protein
MKLQPPSAPLDAFFAPVRRRHPDVDIVVLPTTDPARSGESLGEAEVLAALDRVAGTLQWVSDAGFPTAATPPARLGFGPDEGTVVASARSSVTTPDGFGALVVLRGALEGEGWRLRRPRGAVERLSGVLGALRVHASYAESSGALLLEVSSEPMFVGPARARELVRR